MGDKKYFVLMKGGKDTEHVFSSRQPRGAALKAAARGEEDIKLRVTLTHLADASSVEREDLDEEARGRLILDNLRQSIAAEVSYE